MIPARINTFIKGNFHKMADESGRVTKGGFTLRYDLFALATANRKRKTKRH